MIDEQKSIQILAKRVRRLKSDKAALLEALRLIRDECDYDAVETYRKKAMRANLIAYEAIQKMKE